MKEQKLSLKQRVLELEAEVTLLRDCDFYTKQRALDLEFERLAFEKKRHEDYINLERDKISARVTFSHDLGC